jgi:ferrochelatase
MKAVLLLAHGAPQTLDEIEDFVLRIRHGRPLSPELLADIKERYRLVGGSPLRQWTEQQAAGLQNRLQEAGMPHEVFIGMRYSHPFVQQTVEMIFEHGISSVIVVCLAPQFSSRSIGAYAKALEDAIGGRTIEYDLVQSYARHPKLIEAFAVKLRAARQQHPAAFTVFTAHSLPQSVLQQKDPYDIEVKETARLVAEASGVNGWTFAYQSQGLTQEPWLGPSVESVLQELASQQIKEVIVAPIGFVCDHVEILYDVDILYRGVAARHGIELHRTVSLNDSPEFIDLLFSLVAERL